MHGLVLVDLPLAQALRDRLPYLLACVVAGAWHFKSVSDIDLLPPLRRLEGGRAGCSQHTIILRCEVRISSLVLTRAQSTINGLLTEAFNPAAEQLKTIGTNFRLERAILGPIGAWTGAWFLCHFLLLTLEIIKVTTNRCIAFNALLSAHLLDTAASEGWLIRFKEATTIVVVTSRADRYLR